MEDRASRSGLRDLLSCLCELRERLHEGVEQVGASLDQPDAMSQCLDELARLRDLAAEVTGEIDSLLRALNATRPPRTKAYSVHELTDIIASMVNEPGARRRHTYIPPFDIEKTLIAFRKLRRQTEGDLRIIVDDEQTP